MVKKTKIKRKIKWKHVLKIVCFLFLFFLGYLWLMNIPTKHIVIEGNNTLKDLEIITMMGYNNYPPLFKESNHKIKTLLLKNDYIDDVKITKKLNGELRVKIEEAKPIFYNRDKNRLILSNHKEIETQVLNGVPILTNYVPDNLYNRLIDGFRKIDTNVISLISEIIYDPWRSNDVMIDDTRFFLRMNDGNHVYVNLIHLEKLNNYIEIYATLEGKKGNLYLDSSSDKISFSLF